MKPELWAVCISESGSGFDIVGADGLIGQVADFKTAAFIVAAHNAAVFRMGEELERVSWLAEANYEAWLAATGQNGGGRPATHNPITGSNSRPAMRHSALGRS